MTIVNAKITFRKQSIHQIGPTSNPNGSTPCWGMSTVGCLSPNAWAVINFLTRGSWGSTPLVEGIYRTPLGILDVGPYVFDPEGQYSHGLSISSVLSIHCTKTCEVEFRTSGLKLQPGQYRLIDLQTGIDYTGFFNLSHADALLLKWERESDPWKRKHLPNVSIIRTKG